MLLLRGFNLYLSAFIIMAISIKCQETSYCVVLAAHQILNPPQKKSILIGMFFLAQKLFLFFFFYLSIQDPLKPVVVTVLRTYVH